VSGRRNYNLVVLAEIVSHPKRLKVSVMETFGLFFWLGEIKAVARNYMVNVPTVVTIVVPRHAFCEF
jgi:hypothetical protein